MARTSINLVSLKNYAWDKRTLDSPEYLQDQVRNLVSYALPIETELNLILYGRFRLIRR